jgi:glucose-6-phosphate 1-epimerase
MIRYTLQNPFGQLVISEYGGQLLSWKNVDGIEQFYTPDNLQIQPGKALRGGVPICFPQFSGRGELPKHGFVRTKVWRLVERSEQQLVFSICHDAQTFALWPYEFELTQTITLNENGLCIALDFHNLSQLALNFTAALHSYLRVSDVTQVQLIGLNDCVYEDAADDGRYKTQQGDLRITGEVDRVFAEAPKQLFLKRASQGDLIISQDGFSDTVVWCPGPVIVAAFSDMPEHDWQRMLCVEAAVAAAHVHLAAGGHWQGWQRFTVNNSV